MQRLSRPTQSPSDRPGLSLKLFYALGDHTLNLTLSSLSLLYVFFLTEVIGLRPLLAGAVPLVGRAVDAFTDPIMGRISDLTRSRLGRRRPWFLIGAIPFGLSFALLWLDPGFESQWASFAWFASAYALYSVASTVLAVPYVAILPEIVPDYDDRTSIGGWKAALAITGTLVAAAGFRPLAAWLGGGPEELDWAGAGLLLGVWVALAWPGLFAVTRERPATSASAQPLRTGLGVALAHRAYLQLCGLYIFGRMAMDMLGALLVFYFAYWIGRSGDFEVSLAVFLVCAVASLPLWVRLGVRLDKHRAFAAGALWWGVSLSLLAVATPEWPSRTALIGLIAVSALGYGVVDMMPWAMLADVMDEAEVESGEQRAGLYAGLFTFVRKLAGAIAVFLVGAVLDAVGFQSGGVEQSEGVRRALRWATAVLPAIFVLSSAGLALLYPLGRERVQEVRRRLEVQSTPPATR